MGEMKREYGRGERRWMLGKTNRRQKEGGGGSHWGEVSRLGPGFLFLGSCRGEKSRRGANYTSFRVGEGGREKENVHFPNIKRRLQARTGSAGAVDLLQ